MQKHFDHDEIQKFVDEEYEKLVATIEKDAKIRPE